jgi:hypothetical protein
MTAGFFDRLVRTARLDRRAFAEVEEDPRATGQAALVVGLSALAAGIGGGGRDPGSILAATLGALLSWYVLAGLVYWIGARWLPEPGTVATHGQVLRVVGFASGPGLLRVLGMLPEARAVAFLVAGIWMLLATIVGVREALDYESRWRAVGVTALGWLAQALLLALVLWMLAPTRPA